MLAIDKQAGEDLLLGHRLQLAHDDTCMFVLVHFDVVKLDSLGSKNVLNLLTGDASRVRVKLYLVRAVEPLDVLFDDGGSLRKFNSCGFELDGSLLDCLMFISENVVPGLPDSLQVLGELGHLVALRCNG